MSEDNIFLLSNVVVLGCGDEPVDLSMEKLETLNFNEMIKADVHFNDLKVKISRDVLLTFLNGTLTIDIKELKGTGKLLEYLGELQTLREENASFRNQIKI